MSNFLSNIVKGIDNTNIIDEGKNSSEFSGTIDTGSYALNALISGSIYGGVPNNKITAFAGESATGKTFFVLGVLKTFLEQNPTGGVIYFDTEAAVTKKMMSDRGIDTKRVVISEPQSIEEFRTNAVRMLDSYNNGDEKPPMMMVLDSLGMLSSNKELEDVESGKPARDMTKAQLLRGTFRVLSLKLAKANVPMLITNHVYDVVGAYIPTKEISGGSGLKYAASSIAMLSKKKDRDESTKELVGNIIKVSMFKSRFTKEGKTVEVRLSFDKGLNRYFGLLDIAEKYGIIKKVSTRYELPDGSKVFGKAINSEPEKYYTEEVLRAIDDACKKEFMYGAEEEQPVIDEEEQMDEV